MPAVTINIQSTNPDLVARVRAGLVHWNEQLGLDIDAAGAFHDLELHATSDQPGNDGVVYGTVFEGEANGAGTEVAGLWMREIAPGVYDVLDNAGDTKLAGYVDRISGHDEHGVTLLDCAACQSGETTLHRYERT